MIGKKIVDAIIAGKLVTAGCAEDDDHSCVVVWSANVHEQIDAIVQGDKVPGAMVLVYQPELTHSVWIDYESRHRSRGSLEKALRKGVKDGEWVAWRLVTIHKEVAGND